MPYLGRISRPYGWPLNRTRNHAVLIYIKLNPHWPSPIGETKCLEMKTYMRKF